MDRAGRKLRVNPFFDVTDFIFNATFVPPLERHLGTIETLGSRVQTAARRIAPVGVV